MNAITGRLAAYRPVRLDAEAARLARSLSRRRGGRDLCGWEIEVVAPPEESPEDSDQTARFGLALGEGTGMLAVPRAMLAELLRALDEAGPLAAPDAVPLMVELALEPMLVRLEAQFPALTVALRSDTGELTEAFAVGLAVRCGDVAGTIRLDLDRAGCRAVAASLASLPDRPGVVPALPVPLHLRVLSADVTAPALRAARAGDVILAEILPGGEILAVAGERFAWRARRAGGRIEIVTPRLMAQASGLGEWVMDEESDIVEETEIGELPVRLSFEIGRLTLPLAEIAVLGPGHVFELGRDEDGPVDILANGRRIGAGRIVSVAGAIGVQILRIGRE